jgi:hypothetical protein
MPDFNMIDASGNFNNTLLLLKPKIKDLASSEYIANDLYALTPNEFQVGYNTTDIIPSADASGNIISKTTNTPLSTTEDAAKEDINTMLLQQNTLYTMGVLTATTFLITAILLAK